MIAGTARWTLHHKLSFGFELAPNVLEREDESFLNQFLQRARKASVNIIDAVRRAVEENRQRFTMGFWRIDDRVEFDTIAHGNHLFDLIEAGRRVRRLCVLRVKRGVRE